MQTDNSDKKECGSTRTLKTYHHPKVLVYGDVKKITLNASGVGTTDNAFEGRPCQSPGNCG